MKEFGTNVSQIFRLLTKSYLHENDSKYKLNENKNWPCSFMTFCAANLLPSGDYTDYWLRYTDGYTLVGGSTVPDWAIQNLSYFP